MVFKFDFPVLYFGRFVMPFIVAIIVLCLHPMAMAESSIVVVVNGESPIEQLSREEVASLFLGKTRLSSGVQVMTIDSDDALLRERFYLGVANMNSLRLKAYWSRIVFSGQGRPPQELSTEEARSRIENDTEMLTYLPVERVTQDMRIVFSIPKSSFIEH